MVQLVLKLLAHVSPHYADVESLPKECAEYLHDVDPCPDTAWQALISAEVSGSTQSLQSRAHMHA